MLPGNSLTVVVENDTPADTTAVASLTVDEDELSTAAGDNTNGIPDGDAVGDEGTFTNAQLQALVLHGADEQAVFSLNTAVSGVLTTSAGELVTSQGQNIRLGFDGTKVVGYVDNAGGTPLAYNAGTDRVVFAITKNPDGSVTFDPHRQDRPQSPRSRGQR